jgi:5'-3' exonuclease
MENNTKQITVEARIKEVLKGTGFESYQYGGFESADELIEHIRTEISEDEVIYYSNAMDYLSKNDASLKDSIEIALEFGYDLKSINSELLATLLQQRNLEEELNGLISEIEECFNEVD